MIHALASRVPPRRSLDRSCGRIAADSRDGQKNVFRPARSNSEIIDADSLEQLIALAYSRKGKRLTLSKKAKTAISEHPHLGKVAEAQLLEYSGVDLMLLGLRQLLLAAPDFRPIRVRF